MLLLVLRSLLKTRIGLKNPAYRFIRHFLAATISLLVFPAFFFFGNLFLLHSHKINFCVFHTRGLVAGFGVHRIMQVAAASIEA